jgi:hypothetical protein
MRLRCFWIGVTSSRPVARSLRDIATTALENITLVERGATITDKVARPLRNTGSSQRETF